MTKLDNFQKIKDGGTSLCAFDFLEIIQFSHDVGILLSSILFNIRNNFNCCIRHLLINKWPIQCQSILFLIKLVNQTSDPCI